jgi:hypothetical protein
MKETLDPCCSVHHLQQIASACVVGLVKLGRPDRFRSPGTVDYVGNAFQHIHQTCGIFNRAFSNFYLLQAGRRVIDSAAVSKEDYSWQLAEVQALEDMAAHKPTGACEQDLQSDQVQLFTNRTEFIQR